jgi:hypothetical protein
VASRRRPLSPAASRRRRRPSSSRAEADDKDSGIWSQIKRAGSRSADFAMRNKGKIAAGLGAAGLGYYNKDKIMKAGKSVYDKVTGKTESA